MVMAEHKIRALGGFARFQYYRCGKPWYHRSIVPNASTHTALKLCENHIPISAGRLKSPPSPRTLAVMGEDLHATHSRVLTLEPHTSKV